MEVATAIKLLNMYLQYNQHKHDFRTAIETILVEYNNRYYDGYRDGYAQGKVEGELYARHKDNR